MKRFLLFTVIFIFHTPINSIKESTTPNVEKRIALLKKQIASEINAKNRQSKHLRNQDANIPIDKSDDVIDNDEFSDNSNLTITPIMDSDDRKEKESKLKKIKPTTTTQKETQDIKLTPTTTKDSLRSMPLIDPIVKTKVKRKLKPKVMPTEKPKGKPKVKKNKALVPKDIFYRRVIDDKLSKIQPWMHCQALITPYLEGYKTEEFKKTKTVSFREKVVTRLIHLLSVNTTGQTKDEIYSVMYEISNLQLRLFHWDFKAMKSLLNFFIKDSPQRFRALKHGVHATFTKWHLDLSNVTNLLKQSRLFRPPCVKISDVDGSTTPLRELVNYPKMTTKRPCHKDESGELCVKKMIIY